MDAYNVHGRVPVVAEIPPVQLSSIQNRRVTTAADYKKVGLSLDVITKGFERHIRRHKERIENIEQFV